MIDDHYYPLNWGIKPILFQIGNLGVPAYAFFVLLGLMVGLAVYFYEARRQKVLSENGFFIVVGSLLGGIVGARVLQALVDYSYFFYHFSGWEILFSGRTIIGCLIGGTLGAILTKKILGINEKRGNLFAPAIAIGVAIGRLGCFFRGCCYGQPTNLPWGVNFGDGIMRHPTQIYESLFMLAMFIYLERIKNNKDIKPGQLFKILMISYFVFRFFMEFIRVERLAFAGLTFFQIICLFVIIYLIRDNIRHFVKNNFKIYG